MKVWLKNTFRHAAWAPSTVFILYVVASKVFKLSILYPWADMPAHFFGGVAITYFYFIGVRYFYGLHGSISKLTHLAISVGLTVVTCIVWEFLECLSDSLYGTKLSPGLSDTLSDLFFGLLGAFVFAGLAARSRRLFQLTTRDIGERA